MMRTQIPALLLMTLVGACAGTTDGEDPPLTGDLSSCDPLDPSVCALPFPSSHFLKADESTVTGLRVNFGETSLPLNRDGVQTLPDLWNERDGYSINSPVLLYLPDVVLDGVIGHDDLDAYTAADAKTVILNTTTGERVPHWVEMDATAPDDSVRVMMLRPAVPLDWNTTYVVGIRGMTDKSGGQVAPSPAFLSLRDDTESSNLDVNLRRQHFEDTVFPPLETAGFARGDLQIAWDFHTASRDNTLGRVDFVLQDALAWVGEEGGFDYTLTKVEPHECVGDQDIAVDIEGVLSVPLYMEVDSPEIWDNEVIEALLTRDEDGMPYRNGVSEADFIARIPCSVVHGADGEGPVAGSAPIVQYGHGLLGSKGEARGGYLARMANRNGFVILALDWTGFMEDDNAGILFMLSARKQENVNASQFAIVSERAVQGMVEQVLATRLFTTEMVDDPAFSFEGVKVLDPTRPYYYGNSQGAIMGGALLAMSPDIHRGVLGVGGGPYSLLLPRSHDFDPFFLLLKNKYSDHREIMLFVAGLTQQLWDPTESAGWLWDMARDATSDKAVLQQVAIYDNQVSTLGAQIQARAYGAFTPSPAVRPIWGVEEVDVGAGRSGNAIVEWRYESLPDEPFEALPPATRELIDGTVYDDGRALDPHECPRREREAQDQLWHFLETGEVIQTCGPGGCVSPAVDGCGD